MRDENCIFCKIIAGEIPARTIYEDEDFKVILDANPASRGHALILPKEHAAWKTFLLDIANSNGHRSFINLSKHLLALQQMGYHPQSLVARYLCEEYKEGIVHIYFKAYVKV